MQKVMQVSFDIVGDCTSCSVQNFKTSSANSDGDDAADIADDNSSGKRHFTVSEISEILHVNPETVRRWTRCYGLKPEQTGESDKEYYRHYYTKEELFRFFCSERRYGKYLQRFCLHLAEQKIAF